MILPCIVCDKPLRPAVDQSINQPAHGVVFETYGHYGSTFFDPTDGSKLEINICDDCLKRAFEANTVKSIQKEE